MAFKEFFGTHKGGLATTRISGPGQLIADTDSALVYVHDGVTAGGTVLATGLNTLNMTQYSGFGKGKASVDSAAFTAALAVAAAHPGTTILLPVGVINLTTTSGFVVPAHTTIRGAGMFRTKIVWNDAVATSGNLVPAALFVSAGTTGSHLQDVVLEDFKITGSWATAGVLRSQYPIYFQYIDFLTVRRVCSEYSRGMGMTISNCSDVNVQDCLVRYCGQDGIYVNASPNVTVSNNTVVHCDDDGISVHSSTDDVWGVRSNLLITNNRLFDCQGIKVLSARQATISNNNISFCRVHGISVATLSAIVQGAAATIAVTINGNTITNLYSRQNVDNAATGCPGIIISGDSARAGSAAAIPGEAASGAVVNPYAYVLSNSIASNIPTAGSHAITVVGNLIKRTLPPCNSSVSGFTKVSDYGFSPNGIFVAGGWFNGTLAASDFLDYGISLSVNVVRDVLISSNMFHGLKGGLFLGNSVRTAGVVFCNNSVIDFTEAGVQMNTFGASNNVQINDNLFDGDPYVRASNRTGTVGNWTSTPAPPYGIYLVNGSGLFVLRNRFKNLWRVANIATTDIANACAFDENIVEAWPAGGNGYNSGNRGVAYVEAEGGCLLQETDSAPADGSGFDSSVGQTPIARTASSIPTGGFWAEGRFLRNSTPSIATGKILLGWLRLTTGGGNVAGTDWQAVFVTTS